MWVAWVWEKERCYEHPNQRELHRSWWLYEHQSWFLSGRPTLWDLELSSILWHHRAQRSRAGNKLFSDFHRMLWHRHCLVSYPFLLLHPINQHCYLMAEGRGDKADAFPLILSRRWKDTLSCYLLDEPSKCLLGALNFLTSGLPREFTLRPCLRGSTTGKLSQAWATINSGLAILSQIPETSLWVWSSRIDTKTAAGIAQGCSSSRKEQSPVITFTYLRLVLVGLLCFQ